MKLFLCAVLLVAVVSSFRVDRATWTKDGRPRLLFGEFGALDALTVPNVRSFLKRTQVTLALRFDGSEDLIFRNQQSFKDAVATFRFDQRLNGLEVFGGDLAVHVTPSTKQVHGFSANVLRASSVPLPSAAVPLGPELKTILNAAGHTHVKVSAHPHLVYVVDDADQGRLAYLLEVISQKHNTMTGHPADHEPAAEPFDIYIDAITHELIMDIPLHQKALFRQVFDVENGKDLPGPLVRTEGQTPISDRTANQAYDNAGLCYNFYLNVFQRDSWNNEGAPLNSTVHYKIDYDNAFWNGNQMVYGDGDNKIFANFTNDLTVICHELSHAVTQSTSNLRYWYESGALNEAFSDIMGSSSAIYTNDPVNDIPDPSKSWVIGQNCTLTNLNPTGCPDCPLGLRFMNNPALDGSSRDYYPDRYTGLQDERGVHWNSGIANLAYVLTIQGGAHPQQKTNVYVEPVGMSAGQNIYYVGFTQYLTSTSTFQDARHATEHAATVLYNSKDITDSVTNAWTAVGVA